MINVKLLCVGKLKEKFYADACAEYAKRLGRYCRLDITELPESRLPQAPTPGEIAAALEKEGEAIRARIPPGSIVVALCVEGEAYSSEQLAQALTRWAQAGSKGLVLVIGGSYGLHPSVKKLARLTPYFSAYFIRDCRYAMSCVILLLMKDMAPSHQVVVRNFNFNR